MKSVHGEAVLATLEAERLAYLKRGTGTDLARAAGLHRAMCLLADYLRGAGRRMDAQQDWQPIETAPKDHEGPAILTWNGDVHLTTRGFTGTPRTAGWFDERSYMIHPTHWMPLPAPPRSSPVPAYDPHESRSPDGDGQAQSSESIRAGLPTNRTGAGSEPADSHSSPRSSAVEPPEQLAPEQVQLLAWAVSNCHTLARRALAKTTSVYDREKWEHVLRICDKAGARSKSVLRASLPTEVTDGSDRATFSPPVELETPQEPKERDEAAIAFEQQINRRRVAADSIHEADMARFRAQLDGAWETLDAIGAPKMCGQLALTVGQRIDWIRGILSKNAKSSEPQIQDHP